tara:strand:+ start:17966 stop:19078 length:1113 start_codon:yes stop_codon:yes gene_type:complete
MIKIHINLSLVFYTLNTRGVASFIFLFIVHHLSWSQYVIEANGPGNTYEELTAFLAPGHNPIEVPDCNHSSFGNHIDEVYDTSIGGYAYRFFIHVTPDNDRCIDEIDDRQRNEIKTYNPSPSNFKGTQGENVIYKWAFKLPAGFQSSPKFTHIHQLKSVGGDFQSMPMYTLTTRKGSPDKLELRYAETTSQITLSETPLSPFLNNWVEVTEKINYSFSGFYSISIVDMDTENELFYYDNTSADEPKVNWRPGGEFVRPKWGIYRSLVYSEDLRDEEVLFSYFSFEEVSSLSANDVNSRPAVLYPNPTSGTITINSQYYNYAKVYDLNGKLILRTYNDEINIGHFTEGLYVVKLFDNVDKLMSIHKVIKTN